jgi:hypothetical protein
MNRYFFDVVAQEGSRLDYTGRLMSSEDDARVAAELIALDIAVKQTDRALGSTVTVSDAHGRTVFSIPINLSLLASAFGSEGPSASPLTIVSTAA